MTSNTPSYTPVYLSIVQKNNKKLLIIRKDVLDVELMRSIIKNAFYKRPMVFRPTFRDDIRALSVLSESGIIEYSATENVYYFKE